MTRDDRQAEIGAKLIETLGLHTKTNGRVNTTWGDKTPLGLYLTVKRIIEENETFDKASNEGDALRDLLTDILHYCRSHDISFERKLRAAWDVAQEEMLLADMGDSNV